MFRFEPHHPYRVVDFDAHPWPQVLDIRDCGLSDAACWCIVRGIIRHKNIQSVDLHGNHPGSLQCAQSFFFPLTCFVVKCAGSRFAVALQHLKGHHYPLQCFSGAFELDSDWLNLVGVPLQQKHANTGGYERPPLPIDCDLLRMTSSLPSDDSNYNL